MDLLGPSPPRVLPLVLSPTASPSPGVDQGSILAEEATGRVHVAVGRSTAKGEGLLRWAFRRFGCREVVLVHVHRPSPTIPTLLGNLPASGANEGIVLAHRSKEKKQLQEILLHYLNVCSKAQVLMSVLTVENELVQEGIVDLISRYDIRRLVMGTALDNIASEPWILYEVDWTSHNPTTSASQSSSHTAIDEERGSLDLSQDVVDQNFFQDQLRKANAEAQRSEYEIFIEVLKRRKLMTEATEAVNKIEVFEVALACETKLRKDLEEDLRTVRRNREDLIGQRDEAMRELTRAMETIAMLDKAVQEATCHRNEAAEKLKLMQSSVMSLKIERHKICQQRKEAGHHSPTFQDRNGFPGIDNDDFKEFSLTDLQIATCDFSQSFLIGQGVYGCVYKGEMLNRSVAVKKIHPQNMQDQLEFQQEVHTLGKLRHPNLVALVGACPDAWSLVYDYMPNGSLLDRLFQRSNSTTCWTWEARTHVAAEIASALHFLHSFMPDKIVHGGLKPENILFDSDFSCKVGDSGISRLVPEGSLRCPSFGRSTETTGPFSYSDPEYQRTGHLTPSSDVYSFGVIVLQLLTGRPPAGLASEVRRAMLGGSLSLVLDTTAGEWPTSVATRLAEFGLQCCDSNSRNRPEITAVVVRELEQMHNFEEQSVPHFFLCPILQEIMHDPQVAADGHTYEGKALHDWLENGRETSPMTNLRLDHLNLTPNHVLRLAIQDWLSRSKSSKKLAIACI